MAELSSFPGPYRVREGRGSNCWQRGGNWPWGGDRDLSDLCLGLCISCLLSLSAVGLKLLSYGRENSEADYTKTKGIRIGEKFKYLSLSGRFIGSCSTASRNLAALARPRFLARRSGLLAVLSALVRLLRFLLFSD